MRRAFSSRDRPDRRRVARGVQLLRLFAVRSGWLLCLLVAACTERGPLAAPTLEPLEISVDQTWLRDAAGRVVILRGATYRAIETGAEVGSFRGPAEVVLAVMERLGMNLVRLPLSWATIEPHPGHRTAHDFVRRVDPVIRLAAAHGLAVVLSLRPWPRSSCDESDPAIPAWVCDAIAGAPDPSCAFWQATAAGGGALREHYADTWAFLAQYYAEDARVIGFDVLDEPSAGTCFASIPFVTGHLAPYYHALEGRIRRAGAVQAILVEPPASPGGGTDGGPPLAALPAPAIYSPHLWTQRFGPPSVLPDAGLREAYERAAQRAARLGVPLVVGEYGGDAPATDAAGLRGTSAVFALRSLLELDRSLAGGAYYAPLARPTGSARADFGALAPVLSHPYARRIAGIPLAMSFSPSTLELRLRFADDPRRRPPDPTEIFLPTELYPGEIDVEVEPGGRWHLDRPTQRLLVYRGSGSEHEVHVRPRSDGSEAGDGN